MLENVQKDARSTREKRGNCERRMGSTVLENVQKDARTTREKTGGCKLRKVNVSLKH